MLVFTYYLSSFAFIFFLIGCLQLTTTYYRQPISPRRSKLQKQYSVPSANPNDRFSLRHLKDLYYKLHNLERFPSVLPEARDALLLLLSESLMSLSARASHVSGILSIDQYSKENLSRFMLEEHEKVAKYWDEYVGRRNLGSQRELFNTRERAESWIKQACPLKYVDGAWLGHLNQSATPFALRGVTKTAWQILSEEYGDGHLERHHAHLYSKLVREVDPELPPAYTEDFINPRHGLIDVPIWKAAVTQLLISLFPHEFLPEILGFNLHFESLSTETLVANRELAELRLDPYYFLLHISIDNTDSGHAAMALKAIDQYMEHIQKKMGTQAARRAWRGIQAGFVLSQNTSSPASRIPESLDRVDIGPLNRFEMALDSILLPKCHASHRLHCNTNIKVGQRRLSEWLTPVSMASQLWRTDFLVSLGMTGRLVCRGHSSKSRLVQSLLWGRKMFGAFTDNEVTIVKNWINSLQPLHEVYWNFIGEPPGSSEIVVMESKMSVVYPIYQPPCLRKTALGLIMDPSLKDNAKNRKINLEKLNLERFLPIWFAPSALLERLVAIPSKVATIRGCSILRLLRAQNGFGVEGSGVTGKDECHSEAMGLVDIGLEIARSRGHDKLTSMRDVLERWPCEFAEEMLGLSMTPEANLATLFGLVWAFVDLHRSLISLLSISDGCRSTLQEITRREENLSVCFTELDYAGVPSSEIQQARTYGASEIEKCFS